jgi:hypothetical protein
MALVGRIARPLAVSADKPVGAIARPDIDGRHARSLPVMLSATMTCSPKTRPGHLLNETLFRSLPQARVVLESWPRLQRRAPAFAVVNYEQAVEPFLKTDRLSDAERAMLMGGATAKTYGWSPKKA